MVILRGPLPAILVLALLGGCGAGEADTEQAPAPLAVHTLSPTRGTLRETADYVGTTRARQRAQVRARIAGTLVSLPRAEGEPVTKGERLATLAAPEQQARVSQAGSEVARVRADADHACTTYDTDRELHERGVLTRAQLDASRTACDRARAALGSARAQRHQVGDVHRKRLETAPFDGRVLEWLAEPGEHVMPGQPLLLVGGDAMEVRVDVVERDLRRGIAQGTPALVVLANGREVTTEVGQLAATSHGPAHAVEVVLPLPPEATAGLAHGSSADVRFVLRERTDAWIVPEEAVQSANGGAQIFRVSDGRAEALPVELLLRADGRIALEGDLGAEDRVVIGAPQGLAGGTHVYPVPAGTDPGASP